MHEADHREETLRGEVGVGRDFRCYFCSSYSYCADVQL